MSATYQTRSLLSSVGPQHKMQNGPKQPTKTKSQLRISTDSPASFLALQGDLLSLPERTWSLNLKKGHPSFRRSNQNQICRRGHSTRNCRSPCCDLAEMRQCWLLPVGHFQETSSTAAPPCPSHRWRRESKCLYTSSAQFSCQFRHDRPTQETNQG